MAVRVKTKDDGVTRILPEVSEVSERIDTQVKKEADRAKQAEADLQSKITEKNVDIDTLSDSLVDLENRVSIEEATRAREIKNVQSSITSETAKVKKSVDDEKLRAETAESSLLDSINNLKNTVDNDVVKVGGEQVVTGFKKFDGGVSAKKPVRVYSTTDENSYVEVAPSDSSQNAGYLAGAYKTTAPDGTTEISAYTKVSLPTKSGTVALISDIPDIAPVEAKIDNLKTGLATETAARTERDSELTESLASVRSVAESAKSIAQGRQKAQVFDTKDDMDAWLEVPGNIAQLSVGDNLYIRDTGVTDFWWDGAQATPLETRTVNLDDVYTKTQTDAQIAIERVRAEGAEAVLRTEVTEAKDLAEQVESNLTTTSARLQDQVDTTQSIANAVKIQVDNLVKAPDVSEAGNVGTPAVSFTDDGRFKFANIKGEPGEDGVPGTPGGIVAAGAITMVDGVATMAISDTVWILKDQQGSDFSPTDFDYAVLLLNTSNDGTIETSDGGFLHEGQVFVSRVQGTTATAWNIALENGKPQVVANLKGPDGRPVAYFGQVVSSRLQGSKGEFSKYVRITHTIDGTPIDYTKPYSLKGHQYIYIASHAVEEVRIRSSGEILSRGVLSEDVQEQSRLWEGAYFRTPAPKGATGQVNSTLVAYYGYCIQAFPIYVETPFGLVEDIGDFPTNSSAPGARIYNSLIPEISTGAITTMLCQSDGEAASDGSFPATSAGDVVRLTLGEKLSERPVSPGSPYEVYTLYAVTKFEHLGNVLNGTGVRYVDITAPEDSTEGTLTESQFNVLQLSRENKIVFNKEIFTLQDQGHDAGYNVYTHVGHNSQNSFMVKCITVNMGNKSWVLTKGDIGADKPQSVSLTASSGDLTVEEFSILMSSKSNYIILQGTPCYNAGIEGDGYVYKSFPTLSNTRILTVNVNASTRAYSSNSVPIGKSLYRHFIRVDILTPSGPSGNIYFSIITDSNRAITKDVFNSSLPQLTYAIVPANGMISGIIDPDHYYLVIGIRSSQTNPNEILVSSSGITDYVQRLTACTILGVNDEVFEI